MVAVLGPVLQDALELAVTEKLHLDVTEATRAAGLERGELVRLLGPSPLIDTEPPDWLTTDETPDLWMRSEHVAIGLNRVVSVPGGPKVVRPTVIHVREEGGA